MRMSLCIWIDGRAGHCELTGISCIIDEKEGQIVNGDEIKVPAELKEESKFWEDVSADAWEKFLEWEREAPTESGDLLELQ